MPNAPKLDGLPLWLQIGISLAFGLATLVVALRGYLKPDRGTGTKAGSETHVLSATIADMGAIRHLTDVCIDLGGKVERLEDAITEQTHHDRNRNELLREMCQRMREIREALERRRRGGETSDRES